MQVLSKNLMYSRNMQAVGHHLKTLRLNAGLSLRELARQIEVHPSNVSFWENQDTFPSSSILLKMASALGVSVDEILGATPKKNIPKGKMAKLFAEASELPKSKQERISIVLEDMLTAQRANS